ncbi:MAG: IS256 family transposase [Limnochordia bacterium]
MAQYQITLDSEILQHIFTGDNGMARLLEQVLNQVLNAQVAEQIQAKPYERTEERQAYRNGFRPRTMNTRVGTLVLQVPRLRSGQFSTQLFERYQRSEQALVLALMEMVVNGVSTRKVQRITEELCGVGFSKSTVSELCRQLDPAVNAWNERPIKGGVYPFVLVDGLQIKVRMDSRVEPHSCLLAIGVNKDGFREILGLMIGDSESEASWSTFFEWLKQRGLSEVDLVVSDNHKGLVKAVQRHFQGVLWQRCQVHFMRNILDNCPKRYQDELKTRLRPMFDAIDMPTARKLLSEIVTDFAGKAPKAIECLENGFEDAMAVMAIPEHYRRRLRSTNMVERLNEEIRRRERVIRIFPNETSALRLLGAVLMEHDEQWTTTHRYFNMDKYWEWKAEQEKAIQQEQADRQTKVA